MVSRVLGVRWRYRYGFFDVGAARKPLLSNVRQPPNNTDSVEIHFQ